MPDSFGFETPKEALARINERFSEANARIAELGDRATPGAQAGQALANIFGRGVKKRLDTRRERIKFRDEVMAKKGLSKKEAMAQARASVSVQHAELRQAQKMQNIEKSGRTMMDEMIEFGHPEARARAFGMFEVSRRLSDAGFPQEASRLKIEASELLQAQEQRELDIEEQLTGIANTRSTQRDRDVKLGGDSDNFIRLDEGRIVDTANILVTDVDQREEKSAAEGWFNIGNASVGVDFAAGDFGKAPFNVDGGIAENITAGISMLESIKVFRSITDQVGWVEGAVRDVAGKYGIDWFDNQGFIDVAAARKKMRADIQSLVKGIPSNYDAGIFEGMIPDPGAFKDRKFYVAQLNVLERETTRALQLTAAFHKGTRKPIPAGVLVALQAAGVDVGAIPTMSAEDVAKTVRDKDKPLAEQDNPFSDLQNDQILQVEALKEGAKARANTPTPAGDAAVKGVDTQAIRDYYGTQ